MTRDCSPIPPADELMVTSSVVWIFGTLVVVNFPEEGAHRKGTIEWASKPSLVDIEARPLELVEWILWCPG